jgi:hypothetical protein
MIGPGTPMMTQVSRTAQPRLLARSPSYLWVPAVAIVIAVGIYNMTRLFDATLFSDGQAYWDAAIRLRSGGELFPPLADPQGPDVYRYSPWFAVMWVPLTFLPHGLVVGLWTVVLAVAGGWALWQAFRRGSLPLAMFMLPFMAIPVAAGNVQPLIVAGLLRALERRSSPVIVALSASLKGVPIALAAVYLGRREWRRAVVALVATAVLIAPLLVFDLANYPLRDGGFDHHYGLPWPWTGFAAIALSVVLARTRFAWLAGGVALLFLSPGVQAYHLTYLLLGLARSPSANAMPSWRRPATDTRRAGAPT